MRKRIFLPLILLLAFIISAYIPAEVMYVDGDVVKVYEERDLNSDIVHVLHGGDQVLLETMSDDQRWCGILVEDKDGNGQTIGWIPMSNMSYVMPSRYCPHQWTEWIITSQPTCTSMGMRTRNCNICGMGESQDIGYADHTFGGWTTIKQATCKTEGEQSRTCMNCGYEERQTVPVSNHTYSDWENTKKATCTSEGERIRKCRMCGYEEKQVLDKLPHNFGDWKVTKEASCKEEGEQTHKCRDCGYEEKAPIEKLPHEFEWKIEKEATDHSAGIRTNTCKNCGYKEEEVSYDPEGTLRKGSRGDEVRELQNLLADQNYLNANGADGVFGGGTEKAVKEFQNACGLEPDGIAWPQTIRKLHHRFNSWKTIKPLTRSEAGERERTCKDCDYIQKETVEPEPSFKKGDRGEAIRAIQQMLTVLGHNAGTYDGIYGSMLDAAYEGFAKDHNIEFKAGTITAEQVDCLLNEWIASVPEEEWKEGDGLDTDVNLAMTITPVYEENEDPELESKNNNEDKIITYSWTVTNMGDEDCTLLGVVLNFGEDPNFMKNNYIMTLDGTTLKGDCENNASGTFNIGSNWKEGNMNFCAIAVSEKTGYKWLSNIDTIEKN